MKGSPCRIVDEIHCRDCMWRKHRMPFDAFLERYIALPASVILVATALVFLVTSRVASAQTTQQNVDWNDRRLTSIEQQNMGRDSQSANFNSRLSVVENDLNEIKFISRSVAVAMIGQLTMAGVAMLKKARNG